MLIFMGMELQCELPLRVLKVMNLMAERDQFHMRKSINIIKKMSVPSAPANYVCCKMVLGVVWFGIRGCFLNKPPNIIAIHH